MNFCSDLALILIMYYYWQRWKRFRHSKRVAWKCRNHGGGKCRNENWKMSNDSAGLENAGLENDGPSNSSPVLLSDIFRSCIFSAPSKSREKSRLTLQGIEFARKGKWKENGRFWRSVEFARLSVGNVRGENVCSWQIRKEMPDSQICRYTRNSVNTNILSFLSFFRRRIFSRLAFSRRKTGIFY